MGPGYHVGGFVGRIFPRVGAVITVPDALIDTARGRSLHNKISRQALTVVMQNHHFNTMPNHFKQTNRGKYDHKERRPSTKAMKRKKYRSITDLKKSGQTRDTMLGSFPKVRFSGNPANVLRGFLLYNWPFPVGAQNHDGVTVQDMANELATWTFQELVSAVELYRDTYVALWRTAVASRPKWRKKIEPKLGVI